MTPDALAALSRRGFLKTSGALIVGFSMARSGDAQNGGPSPDVRVLTSLASPDKYYRTVVRLPDESANTRHNNPTTINLCYVALSLGPSGDD